MEETSRAALIYHRNCGQEEIVPTLPHLNLLFHPPKKMVSESAIFQCYTALCRPVTRCRYPDAGYSCPTPSLLAAEDLARSEKWYGILREYRKRTNIRSLRRSTRVKEECTPEQWAPVPIAGCWATAVACASRLRTTLHEFLGNAGVSTHPELESSPIR